MATLVFTALGSLVGGPIFAAAGALAGGALDMALAGGGSREGPRLGHLAVTTASYGDRLPRQFGRMRVPGTVIWATDLVEQSQSNGGGKGQPSVTTYAYSCSFAVALGSRPIAGLGRIWADGNLLRGEDGALKVGGTLRLYRGTGDQPADPLIAAAEGSALCPAWRGTAYAVFENLQLADFGNRIPALNFEVICDTGTLTLAQVFDGIIDGVDAPAPLEGMVGLSLDGTPADLLATLAPIYPLSCNAAGARLAIAPELAPTAPLAIGEAAVASGQGDFGRGAGFVRTRSGMSETPPRVIRYYDPERDFQTGVQRAGGRPLAGQPRTIEVPAAFGAADAQRLIAKAASGGTWRRETLQWRTTELDPAISPGTLVTAPGQPGIWRVVTWEWRDSGIEISLERVSQPEFGKGAASAGRANLAVDLASGETELVAFELPWDGSGSGDVRQVYAAVSSASAGWGGAELSQDPGDGTLVPLGASGRQRSTIGRTLDGLLPATPFIVDRTAHVTVRLIDAGMGLSGATTRQLAAGANRALIGTEIVQFARPVPLGEGVWRLEGLLRGRGGTEQQMFAHAAGEAFVLLDDRVVLLDPAKAGDAPGAAIVAVGLGDAELVTAPVIGRGSTLRPLSPVHPRKIEDPSGLTLRWVRRARGGWLWRDAVETPLNEQAEAYEVTFRQGDVVAARWIVTTPVLTLGAADVTSLRAALPGGEFQVRQQGTYALSLPLVFPPHQS